MSAYSLATYETDAGPRAALVVRERIYDAAETLQRPDLSSVLAILDDWDRSAPALAKAAANGLDAGLPLAEAKLLAPILYPGAVYCAGANYQDHMDAVAKHQGVPPQPSWREVGAGPFHFLKTPRSVVGPDAAILNRSRAFDFEIELAVVIGRRAQAVSAKDALDHVAGYTVANDLSARDRIQRPQLPASPFRFDWNGHKNFDGSCPLGPWVVPASEIGDPQRLSLKTWVNGELRQDGDTSQMIFSVAEQIEALSRFNTLYPGDVILTGTPKGVGAESGTFLAKGDDVRMQIAEVGELRMVVA